MTAELMKDKEKVLGEVVFETHPNRLIGCRLKEKGLENWDSIPSIWNRLGGRKA